MNLKDNDQNMLFEREGQVIQGANDLLEMQKDSSTVPKEEYETLLDKYKKIVKQSSMLVRMADRTQKELHDLNISFEKKVEERTKELAEANVMLNESMLQAQNFAYKAEQANQAKGQFIANMSHEIRNPLNVILGMADLLKYNGMDEEQKECSESIKSSSQYLLSLLNDILDYSKIEAQQVIIEEKHFKLQGLLEEIEPGMKLEIDKKGIKYKTEHEVNIERYLVGDPIRLKQVIHNLMTNAIKFTEEGVIDFSVKAQLIEDNKVELKVLVKDTGIGIRKEDQENIFKLFSQVDETMSRSQSGTGLGLAISKEIVDLMGGELKVESVFGKGSSFFFSLRLPTYVIPEESVHPPEMLELKDGKEKMVLIVEDNPCNQKLMSKLVKSFGYAFDQALNGKIAVDMLSQKSYDLVLMDIQMPEMDGYEACRVIRNPHSSVLNHSVPIIAVTAHAMKDDRDKCLQAGMNDYLSKPVDKKKLKLVMEECLLKD